MLTWRNIKKLPYMLYFSMIKSIGQSCCYVCEQLLIFYSHSVAKVTLLLTKEVFYIKNSVNRIFFLYSYLIILAYIFIITIN